MKGGFYAVAVALQACFWSRAFAAVYNVPNYEIDALQDLYISTDGFDWAWQGAGNKWNFTSLNPCADSWEGITCTTIPVDGYLHVTEVSLEEYSLRGTLPQSLTSLTQLQVLALSTNTLTGSIPSDFGSFADLTSLALDSNQLNGTIPDTLGQLTQLTGLFLYANLLRGTVPSSLGNLVNLLSLHLWANDLSGTIPPSLGQLDHVLIIYLSSNQLTGTIPEQLGDCGLLEQLEVDSNLLTGNVPASLGQLRQLTTLYLDNNQLDGTIPSVLTQCDRLEVLYLQNNLFIGTIPEALGQLTQLSALQLDTCMLTGPIPASLGDLIQLTTLYLHENRLSGTIPPSLGQCTQLKELALHTNALAGEIPDSLGELRRLRRLYLYSNALTGTIPESLGQLVEISELYVYSNLLTGTLPQSVGQWSRIIEFEATYNMLTGTIADSLGGCTALRLLSLSSNLLSGTVPVSLGNLTQLSSLALNSNRLTGTIPFTLGQCTGLLTIYLSSNRITGTLPDSIGQWTELKELDFDTNSLTGPIPDVFAAWSHLTMFTLFVNRLSGHIPASLGQCRRLSLLNLNSNALTGTIPSAFELLTQLTILYVYDNLLWGSLPDFIGQWPELAGLLAYSNIFTGTIPDTLGQLTALRSLYLYENHLSGPIPKSLGQCGSLSRINMVDNHLSGTIPDTLGQLSNVVALYVSSNSLSGCIPDSLARLVGTMTTLSFDDNLLTGTIPSALFGTARNITGEAAWAVGATDVNALELLFLDSNKLTGSLPEATTDWLNILQLSISDNFLTDSIPGSLVSALHVIDFLFLESNHLSGTLPSDWSATAHSLSYLYLQSNRLSGPIPASLGDLSLLESLNAYNNFLTGSIPSSFQLLMALQALLLHNNHLSGSIDDIVNPSLQTNLSTVQLSGNQLTGTLPAVLFQLPSLSSLTAVDNCLDGPLPVEAICQSASLNALVLDGLHSASACKRGVSLLHRPFKLGTLPACLLSMSSLATLHLSGNGMTGSVPPLAGDVLTDLSLSHNLLTGEIPDSILDRDWDKLDLSYNRLTGTLRSARDAPYGNSTDLYLQHNRLSGEIPGSMQRVGSLSLLEDNIFSCRVDHSDLPQQDSDSDRYSCGSDAVNSALYAWVGAACVLGAVAAVLVLRRSQALDTARTWMRAVTAEAGLSHLYDTFRSAEALVVLAADSAAYCTLLLLPVYAGASYAYPTFTNKYAWTISGAYLSGTVAFALEAVFLLLQLPLVSYAAQWLLGREQTTSASISVPTVTEAATDNRPTPQSSLGIITLSLCVVTDINVAFVIATLRLSGRELTVIQILLAVFKLAYNSFVVPTLQRRVKTAVTGVDTFRLVLVLVNVIVIPCIVVLLISPACYYDALKGSDAVTSSYEYSGDCLSFIVVTNQTAGTQTLACAGAQTAVDTTSFIPPFTYSYQCSSSFVTNYAPTFVIMCVITGFVMPVTDMLLAWLGRTLPPTSWLRSMVQAATASILRELPSAEDLASRRADPLYRPVFDASRLLLSLLTYLALLLTFGALFPPLAICCAVAMLSLLWTARLEVGRYVSSALAAGRQDCLEELDSACRGGATGQQVRRAVYLVLAVSCLFYTLFLFDTLGDAVGFAEAFWVLVVVPLLPALAWAGYYSCDVGARLTSSANNTGTATDAEDPEAGVALPDLSGATAERKQTSANPMHAM